MKRKKFIRIVASERYVVLICLTLEMISTRKSQPSFWQLGKNKTDSYYSKPKFIRRVCERYAHIIGPEQISIDISGFVMGKKHKIAVSMYTSIFNSGERLAHDKDARGVTSTRLTLSFTIDGTAI